MIRLGLPGLLLLGACAAPAPQATLDVDGRGTSGTVSAGAVAVGAGPDGPSAAVRVVDTRNADVTVGTGGGVVSVRPAGGPVKVNVGLGGVSLGL